MGVLPSRSFLERPSDSVKFVRSGNYDVAHIPLTAHFFPSPDCLAFRQLFECRLKQSIKYNWSIPKCRRETVVMDDEGNTTTATTTITATASSSSSCAVAGASSVNVAPTSSSWRVLEKEKAPHRGGTSGDEDGEADPAIPDRGCVHVRAMTHPDGDCVGNTLISFEQMERHLHCSPARCDANTNSTAATTTTTTRTSAQGKEDAQKVADAHHHRFLGSRQRLYRYLVGNNEAFLVGTNEEMQHIHHEELRWRRARAVVVEWRRRMAKLATEEERTYGLAHPPVEVMEAEEVPPPRMFLRCAPQATIVALNCQEDEEGEEMRSSEGEEVADAPGTSSQQQQQQHVVVGGATRKRSSMERVRHRIASEPSLRDGRLHVVEEDGQLYIFALEPNSNNSQGGGVGDASPMVMMMMSSSTSTAASAARGSEGSRPSVERKQHQAALQRHVMTSPVGVGGHPPPPSEANASDAGSFPQSRLTTAVFGVDTTPRSARGAFSSSSSANNDDGASAHDDDDDVAGGVCVDVATLVFVFPITAFQVVGYSGAVEGPCRGTPWLRGLQDDPIEDHYIEVEMQQRFPGHPRPPVLRASYFIDATIGEKILSRASFVSDRRFHATCLRCGLSDGIVRPMWAYCSMVSVPEIQLGREYDQRLHMTIFRFLQLQRTMRERRPDKRWPLGDLIEADLRRIRQLGTDATTTITATTTTTASSSSCASALESCTPWEDLPAMSLEFSKHMAVTTVRGSRSLWRCREEVQSLFMKLFSLDEADPAELGLLDYYYPATATTPPSYTPSCEEITAQCTSSCTFESEDGGLRASQMDYGGTVVLEDYSCTPPPHDDDDGDGGGWKPHQRLGPPRNLELLLQYHNNYVQYLHAPPGDDLEVVLPSSSSRLNPMELEEDGEPMERALIGAVFVVVDASSSARGPTLAHLHDIANLVAKAEKEAAEHPDDGVVVCGCDEEDPLHGQHQWSYPAMTFIDGDSVSYDVVYRRWEHLAVFLSRRRVQLQRIRATQTSSKEEHKSVVVVGTATTLDGKQQQQQQLEQLGVCQPCCVPLEGFLGRLSRCGYLECVVVSWIKRRIRHAQSMHRLHESWLRDARQDYKITQEGRYYISCSTHDGEVFYHGVIPRFAKKEKRRKEKRQMQKMLRNTDEESGTNNNNNNSNSGRGRSGRRARHRSVSRSLSETSCSTRQPRANSREKGSRRNSNTSQQGGGGGVSPTKSLRRGGRPSSVLRLDHRQPANASNSANNGVGGSSGCSSRTKTCRKALALSPPRPTTSRSRSQRHRHTTTTSPSATAGGRTSARHPSRQRDGRAPLPSPSSLCCRCGGPANNNNNNNTSAAFYPGSVSVPVSSADAVVGVEQSGSSPSFPSSMASSPHQPPSNTFFGHTQTSPLYPASHNNNNNSNNSYSGWQGCVPHTAQQPCYTGMDYHGSTTQAMAAPHNARGCCMPTNHNKYPAACASGGGGGGGRRITVDVGNTFHPHLQHPPPSPHQHHYHQHPCQMPHHHRGSGGHSMSVPPPRGAHMRHEDAPPARVSCCSPKRAISPGRYVWDPYQK